MKNSNIQWIGEIPDDWEVHPLFCYFSERKNKNTRGAENNLLSLSYGKIVRKDINTREGLLPESFNTYNIIEKDDIIIRPTDLQNDKRSLRTAIAKEHGIITSAYIALKSNNEDVNPDFFHYLLHTYDIMKVFYNMGNGVRQGLNYSEFSKLLVCVPPLATQTSIATYLDAKCSEIDGLIADINKQIETLNELKKSTITEAVTKGLNKNAKLKDSGIQWIGMIPEGWSVTKVKYIVENPLQYGATESGVDFDDKLPRYIRITDIIDNRLKDEGKLSLTELQSKGFILKDNDILFARSGGTVGKTFIYRQKYGKSAFAGYLIRATISKSNNADFVYYYTLSNCYDNWKSMIFTQATIQNIGADKYNNLLISLPPLTEQQSIATYLDSKCSEFDSIISDKQKQISTLEAYKKSLIYEYVTGKKKVE